MVTIELFRKRTFFSPLGYVSIKLQKKKMMWEERSCHDSGKMLKMRKRDRSKRDEQEPTKRPRKIMKEEKRTESWRMSEYQDPPSVYSFFYVSHLARLNPREFRE